jgi:hypothetical protein
MTSTDSNETGTLLDFPGADALRAAGAVEAPAPAALARTHAAVRAAIEAETAEPALRAPGAGALPGTSRGLLRRLPRGRPRLLTAAAAGVAAAVAAGVLVATGPGGAPGGGASASAVFLNHAAEVAAATPASKAPYWENRSDTGSPAGVDHLVSYTDREGGLLEKVNGAWTYVPPPTAEQRREAAARSKRFRAYLAEEAEQSREHGAKKAAKQITAMAEPRAYGPVLRELRRRDPATADFALTSAAQLLAGSRLTPARRAALYRAMAQVPHVRLDGTVRDHRGRRGVAVDYVEHGRIEFRMIFDARRYSLLEWQQPSDACEGRSCPAHPVLNDYETVVYQGWSYGPKDLPAHLRRAGN